jgi:hypothetical protein
MPIICLPKDKMPVPMAMQRAKDETALPTTAFMVEAARAEAIPILPEKGRSTIGEDMLEDKTDEWGMWTERLCVYCSEAAVKK